MAQIAGHAGVVMIAIRNWIGAFFRWWFAELAASIPTSLRDHLHRPRNRLHIRLSEGGISALVSDGQRDHEDLALNPGIAPTAAGIEIADWLRRRHITTREALVELAGGSVLEAIIGLPVEASNNLPEALAAEIDRQTPFSTEEVYHAFHVMDADERLETLKVRLCVTPRAVIDDAIALTDAAGLSLAAVRPSMEPGEQINLLPSARTLGHANGNRRLIPIMLLAVTALGAAAVYLPTERLLRTAEVADQKIDELEDANAQLMAANDIYDRYVEIQRTLSERKSADVSAIGLLSEITRLMPDHSWLIQMQISEERIALSGFTRDPTNLVRALESSARFSDVQFSAPVTREQGPDVDRFHITLTVQRGSGV